MTIFQSKFTNNEQQLTFYLDKIGDNYKTNLLLNYTTVLILKKLGYNNLCIDVLNKDRKTIVYRLLFRLFTCAIIFI